MQSRVAGSSARSGAIWNYLSTKQNKPRISTSRSMLDSELLCACWTRLRRKDPRDLRLRIQPEHREAIGRLGSVRFRNQK